MLVADPGEPTLTWWTSLPADLEHARTHLAAVTGGDGEALVLDACGYGGYAIGCRCRCCAPSWRWPPSTTCRPG